MSARAKLIPALAALLPLARGLDWSLPSDLVENPLYGAPDNDFDCQSDHNPVIMLHGLSSQREVGLNIFSHHLKDLGYCVFSETYGAHKLVPWVGGLTDMRESAADIASFIKEVKERTGTEKVDLVGHSEGGIMALYVPMTQEGISEVVDHNIALGPAVHGAQYFGFTDIFYIGGDVTRELVSLALETLGCEACDQMATGGDIYNDFAAAERISQEGNKPTIIMSTADTLVAPETSRVEEDGVRNIIIQDTCPDDKVGHAGLGWSKNVWNLVENELNENHERQFECENGLPF